MGETPFELLEVMQQEICETTAIPAWCFQEPSTAERIRREQMVANVELHVAVKQLEAVFLTPLARVLAEHLKENTPPVSRPAEGDKT